MNPVVFSVSRMNVNNFENSVDELQELCVHSCTDVLPVPVQIPEYNESVQWTLTGQKPTILLLRKVVVRPLLSGLL